MKKRKPKNQRKHKHVKEVARQFLAFSLEAIESYCESPIEKQLAYALMEASVGKNLFVHVVPPSVYARLFLRDDEPLINEEVTLAQYYSSTDILVVPNISMNCNGKTYRTDFLLSYKSTEKKRSFVFVECDSFMYHSSPEQLEKDRIRERNIRNAGFEMIRFGGREINKDANKVASEIMDTLKVYGKK